MRRYSEAEKAESVKGVLAAIANGVSVREACNDLPADRQSVVNWIMADDGLSRQYAQAREIGADSMADDIISIARRCIDDDLDANKARVAIDALKWTASKLKPKTYGDRVEAHLTASTGLLEAMQALGRKGLPGDDAKIIEHSDIQSDVTSD